MYCILIGISGYAGSGKDAVGEILCRRYGFHRIAFADALKAEAIDAGWSGRKDAEGRRFLQQLGDQRRAESPSYWIRKVLDTIDQCGHNGTAPSGTDTPLRIVITDVRYRNEAAMIHDRGGLLWRVVRPGIGPANDHDSEHELDRIRPDDYIENIGTLADLEQTVAELMGRLALA